MALRRADKLSRFTGSQCVNHRAASQIPIVVFFGHILICTVEGIPRWPYLDHPIKGPGVFLNVF